MPDQLYTMELMADDTAKLLQALAIERAHILGVSMGGRIALALTLAPPDLANRLVLVSTSARQRQVSAMFNFVGRLHEIHTPTLMLLGRRDKTVPYALTEETQAGIAHTQR
jgi:pimeloyl-ACP methyl ester carboxylesterase